jgi:cell division protein FtsI (penicillin-binding protein 3)
MAKPRTRIAVIEFGLLVGALLVIGQAARLQIVEGAKWRAEAEAVRRETRVIPARRGGIYDRNGTPLAVTQEYFAVGIAPNELRERARDVRTIAKALGIPAGRLAHEVATRRWVYLGGPFSGLQVRPLREIRGVHLEGSYRRHYPADALARGVVGTLSPDSGTGASGIEFQLDSLLRGIPGERVVLKDVRGRRYESPSRLRREPVPGRDVYLTLDAELQEIAERSLDEAMEKYAASGGDIVLLDPRTGELLAVASRRTDAGRVVGNRPTFFTDPFQPGSTAKLFTAAALLSLGRVKPEDRVFAEHGKWVFEVNSRGVTRTIHDDHEIEGSITLAEGIKYSSNIALGKFSERLTWGELYDALRDFGFGSLTGVQFPSEAAGILRRPDQWTRYSQASIAMGYEFGVTPVQLAAAYGAIANDGILLMPGLIKEVRDRDGSPLWHHEPAPVRRAVTPEVAATLREYLKLVVEEGGTAASVRLANYSLAGKTGTARRFDGTAYVPGSYTASFAAIFPADDPLLVVIVKIDDPKAGSIYGGRTAAPLTRAMLEEALAARRSAIDRRRLGGPAEALPAARSAEAEAAQQPAPVVVELPLAADTTPKPGPRAVPDVRGTSIRQAAAAVHRRGFRVAVHGSGRVTRTTPEPGDSARFGATVTLWAE